MGRWAPNARERLEQAALALFTEHGYDRVTTAQIAEAAGLTERSFFRYFADKREVLFARGASELEALFRETIAARPAAEPPLAVVTAAVQAAGEAFDRTRSRQRETLLAAHTELRERDLMKIAGLAAGTAGALRDRGVDPRTADLVAEVGMALFKIAYERWVDADDERPFAEHVRCCLDELRAAATA